MPLYAVKTRLKKDNRTKDFLTHAPTAEDAIRDIEKYQPDVKEIIDAVRQTSHEGVRAMF